jgi:hypothetical protein
LDQQNVGREAGSNLWLFSLKSITQSTDFIWVHCFHLLNFSASTFWLYPCSFLSKHVRSGMDRRGVFCMMLNITKASGSWLELLLLQQGEGQVW